MVDRKDYINGVRGVLDVFQEDPKTPEFWTARLSEANKNVIYWMHKEPHLYSWHLGRYHAMQGIYALLVVHDLN